MPNPIDMLRQPGAVPAAPAGSPTSFPAQQQTLNIPMMQRNVAVIDKIAIEKAEATRQKYRQGKAMLDQRVIENNEWYRLRHWECMRKKHTNMVEPTSGWLFNAIANKHADAMDNIPTVTIKAREQSDEPEAKMLSSVMPVVLEQADFEQVYDDVSDYKLKTGTGIYGIFWDGSLGNGMGDVSIKQLDILNLFWEPGIRDIQDSRNVFSVELVDNDELLLRYPQLRDKLGNTYDVARYVSDDTIDTTEKTAVVDWYYKKFDGNRTILHYCKYCNGEVLFATEGNPQYANGWYDHGQYPFVFDPLFRAPDSPCGFGYIDVAKSAQEYIDRGNQAILQNLLVNARPRHFIRTDGSVNEKEYADITNDFIHVDGNLGQDSIMQIKNQPLSAVYVNMIAGKVDELKEVTGNRDISTGGTASGVTAASAIAAMQEAGSKLSRDSNKSSYRAFRKVCLQILELIRQFYTLPRCFRIIGEQGAAEYIMFSNAGMLPQPNGDMMGMSMGERLPVFDIDPIPTKASPYSRMSQNEMALQFYSAGFFAPQNAVPALACIQMMDFDDKDKIMQQIRLNGMNYQMAMMAAGVPDMGGGEPGAVPPGSGTETSTGNPGEGKHMTDARKRVANSTSPG